jgi:hypothetical protein
MECEDRKCARRVLVPTFFEMDKDTRVTVCYDYNRTSMTVVNRFYDIRFLQMIIFPFKKIYRRNEDLRARY